MLVEIINFFLSPIYYLFEPYITRITGVLTSQKTQRTAVKTIFISIVAFILISVAFVAYLSFYMIYVPRIAHAKPIYLQYHKGDSPYAIVNFIENERYDSFLTADQAYDIVIDLDVPSSDRNVALGNFMVALELKAKNETVQYSSRPCILTYQSGLFRVIHTFWRVIPLVLGFTKEDQKLTVVMFENMIEDAEKPITKALITISNGSLEVYSAQIRLDAHFRGLRYFMYYHSIPTAITFMTMFLTWEVVFSVIAWRSFVSWWQRKVIADSLASPITPITPGGVKVINNIIENNYQDDDSDRTASRHRKGVERISDDNGTITESESEYESSRPASVISPTDTTIVSESGDINYNTESYATDATNDDESNSVISRSLDDDEAVSEFNDDQIDYDDQTEGSATPTTRSRKSTISEASTTNKSEAEDAPSTSSATLTSRLQSDYMKPTKPYVKRSGSSGGKDDSDWE